jgi:hypothetical protein
MQQSREERRRFIKRAGALAFAGFAPAIVRAQGEPLQIGVLTPLTGAGGFDGPRMAKAMQAVIDEVNGNGGLLGRKLVLVVEEPLRGERRQAGRRLVEQQQARVDHQRHRHREHLPLAAGERARLHAPALGEHREACKRLLDAPRASLRIDEAAHLEVLAHAHRRKDVLLLRHVRDAEPADLARRVPRDRLAVEHDRAAARREQAGDRLHERRLACAIRAEDRDDLARPDAQVDALQDLVRGAVAGNDAVDGEERN